MESIREESRRAGRDHAPDGIYHPSKHQTYQYILLFQQQQRLQEHSGRNLGFLAVYFCLCEVQRLPYVADQRLVDAPETDGAIPGDAAKRFWEEYDDCDESQGRKHEKEDEDGSDAT